MKAVIEHRPRTIFVIYYSVKNTKRELVINRHKIYDNYSKAVRANHYLKGSICKYVIKGYED